MKFRKLNQVSILSLASIDVSLKREQQTCHHSTRLHYFTQISSHYYSKVLSEHARVNRGAVNGTTSHAHVDESELVDEALDAAEDGAHENVVEHFRLKELFLLVLFVFDDEDGQEVEDECY